ncbi:small s protein [Diaporthe amygdali]|uniref:small s protein n=1 Tax=Phomopsis amygdali TaxID=1214568 RepID=UPI0022FE7CA9|nr:small s protein [Diaporthe amygdali]KAJ0119586.1 small s protein [Diaporthe amygdali]
MDPISALSLVANIFAVISFTDEVLSTAAQIKEQGSIERHGELFLLSRDLQQTAGRLRTSIEQPSNEKQSQQNAADKEMVELASKAVATASHVSEMMDKIRPKDLAVCNVIKKTALTLWRKREIEEAEQRLKGLRDQLNFRVVVSLRDRLDAQATLGSETFMALDTQTREIAAKFLESQVGLDAILSAQLDSNEQAARRHREIMASLGKGEPESQDPIISTEFSSKKQLWNMDRAFRSSLWYPTMEEREQGIWSPHKGTLDWVFQSSPAETQVPWDDFNNFVTEGCGTYWITGKAGSGKSTLMKHINMHPKLDDALTRWAAGRELFKASFYFYYLGTEMQKSGIGLLRSLVLALMKASHPKTNGVFWRNEEQRFFTHLGSGDLALSTERVKIAFPERFESMQLSSERPTSFEPSRNELLMALNRILQQQPNACFFLSIDGLDEYDAVSTEMSDLAGILKAICQRDNVKAVISSRPWAVFEDAFAASPRLQLHQLTHQDISFYVSDKMEHDFRMQRLLKSHPEESKALMEEVVEASAGVFLWVRLVVQSLMVGLMNRDGVADLQRRLRELPTDLDELYRVMLRRVPDSYRPQTSRLLELAYYGTRDRWKLSVFGLHYAFELDEEKVLEVPIGPLPSEELAEVTEDMERILQSRCLGFVEVVPVDTTWLAHALTPARENNSQPDTWSQYITHWKDASFEPTVALLSSAIHTLKRLQFDNSMESVGIIRSMALYAGYRALEAEQLTKRASPGLLLELDRVMGIHFKDLLVQGRLNDGSLVSRHKWTADEPHISVDPELVKFLQGLSRKALFSKEHVLGMWSKRRSRKRDVLRQPMIPSGL